MWFPVPHLRDDASGRDPDGEVTIRAAGRDAGGGQGEPRDDADHAAEGPEVEEYGRRWNICDGDRQRGSEKLREL